MKYDALKDVVIDGTPHKQGTVITIGHGKVDRLILLGFLAEHVDVVDVVDEEPVVVNRAVKPKSKRGS